MSLYVSGLGRAMKIAVATQWPRSRRRWHGTKRSMALNTISTFSTSLPFPISMSAGWRTRVSSSYIQRTYWRIRIRQPMPITRISRFQSPTNTSTTGLATASAHQPFARECGYLLRAGTGARRRSKTSCRPCRHPPAFAWMRSSPDVGDLHVEVHGDTAIVTGVSSVKATYEGKDISGRYRFTQVYKSGGGKQLMDHAVAPIPRGFAMVACITFQIT